MIQLAVCSVFKSNFIKMEMHVKLANLNAYLVLVEMYVLNVKVNIEHLVYQGVNVEMVITMMV